MAQSHVGELVKIEVFFQRSIQFFNNVFHIFIQTCSKNWNAMLFAQLNFATRFSILFSQDSWRSVASWRQISYAVPLRTVRAHGAPVETKRKRAKEGIGYRDTLMSFSRDVPGAETIDKRRELEVRESHEGRVVWQLRRKEAKSRNKREREREKERKEGRRERVGVQIEGNRGEAAWDRFPSFKFK